MKRRALASTSPLDGGLVSIPANSGYRTIGVDISAFAGQTFGLNFSFDTIDSDLNLFPGIRIDNIEIDTGPVVPEPSTVVLSSIAFAAFGGMALRKKLAVCQAMTT